MEAMGRKDSAYLFSVLSDWFSCSHLNAEEAKGKMLFAGRWVNAWKRAQVTPQSPLPHSHHCHVHLRIALAILMFPPLASHIADI